MIRRCLDVRAKVLRRAAAVTYYDQLTNLAEEDRPRDYANQCEVLTNLLTKEVDPDIEDLRKAIPRGHKLSREVSSYQHRFLKGFDDKCVVLDAYLLNRMKNPQLIQDMRKQVRQRVREVVKRLAEDSESGRVYISSLVPCINAAIRKLNGESNFPCPADVELMEKSFPDYPHPAVDRKTFVSIGRLCRGDFYDDYEKRLRKLCHFVRYVQHLCPVSLPAPCFGWQNASQSDVLSRGKQTAAVRRRRGRVVHPVPPLPAVSPTQSGRRETLDSDSRRRCAETGDFRPSRRVSGGEMDDSAPPVVVAEVKWTIPPLPSWVRR